MKCSVDLSFSSHHNKGEQKKQNKKKKPIKYPLDETMVMLTYNTGDPAVHKYYQEV